jgi:hypothetical protein
VPRALAVFSGMAVLLISLMMAIAIIDFKIAAAI